ncbi:conserved hypothetical protein [Talaromyces stipitatus ATCC 10500]|uniref:Thaumatin-like protein n=1 Tax=Talaromyces stipitatus (strain ATCC 10500 / CBS 375.48 / QM 6759 / NRRL 1006) TaxID=441959 RepID=B8M416_TALSN|nr:uncharacterized protein TSTA_039560 [Talaromyces stipitatus ATCC 10500]EED20759.1 conserved hypothetical protein [Talaromyces stipitatus ATCC 10500]
MNAVSFLYLLALATTSQALPNPTPAPTPASGFATHGLAIDGAMTTRSIAAGIKYANPPECMTIVVVNSHGDTITTALDTNPSAPTPVSGNTVPGTMTNGETASIAVPTNWIGNLAINDARWGLTGDDSLIEANFVVPYGESVAVGDIDVSYVDGFSVAIVCHCGGLDDTVVSGCNKNLFNLNTCPDDDGQNACVNPLRADQFATAPTDFFKPCAGAAYTFPSDSGANSFGTCQTGTYTCCVGAACAANPNQPA